MIPCGSVAALAIAVAMSLSACTPDQAVSVNNNTDVTVRIQDLSGGPPQGVAATYAAGTGGGINVTLVVGGRAAFSHPRVSAATTSSGGPLTPTATWLGP